MLLRYNQAPRRGAGIGAGGRKLEGSLGARDISVPEGINIGRLLRYGARRLWVAVLTGILCSIVGLIAGLFIRPEYNGVSKFEVLPEQAGSTLVPQMGGGFSGISGLGGLQGDELPDVSRLMSWEISRETAHEFGLEVEVWPLSETPWTRFRDRLGAKLGRIRLETVDLAPVKLSAVWMEPDLGDKELLLRCTGAGGFEIVDHQGFLGKRGTVVAQGQAPEGGQGADLDLKRVKFKLLRVEDSQKKYLLLFRPRYKWLVDFRKRLNVTDEKRTQGIITIRFSHYYPETVRDVLRSLLRRYQERMLTQRGESELRRQEFLRSEVERRNEEMRELQGAYYAYREQHKLVDLTSQAKILLDSVGAYDRQISENQLTLDAARKALSDLEGGPSKQFYAGPYLAGRQDSVLGDLAGKLAGLEADREASLKVYTEKHSEVQGLEAKIAEVKKSIRQHLETSIAQLERTGADLDGLRSKHLGDVEKLPAEERQLFDLQLKYTASQELIRFLEEQLSQSELSSASLTSNIRAIDDAEVGDAPAKPKLTDSVVFGGLMGAALGLMAILFMFLGHPQVLDSDDAGEAAPILADLSGKDWALELVPLAGALAGLGKGAGILVHETQGLDTARLAEGLYEAAQNLGLASAALLPSGGRELGGEVSGSEAFSISDIVGSAQYLRSEAGRQWLGQLLGASALLVAAAPRHTQSSVGQLLVLAARECTLVAQVGTSSRAKLIKLARSLRLAGVEVRGVILLGSRTYGNGHPSKA